MASDLDLVIKQWDLGASKYKRQYKGHMDECSCLSMHVNEE